MTDREIDRETATRLHAQTRRENEMLHWVVCHGTADYGDQYVARPHLVRAGSVAALFCHLAANTLDQLRAQLPAGLYRIARHPDDDPVIVETWL